MKNIFSSSSLLFWTLVFFLFLFIFIIIALILKNKELKVKINSLNDLIEEKDKNIKLLEELNKKEEIVQKKVREVKKKEEEKKEIIKEKHNEVKDEEKVNLYNNAKFKPSSVVTSPVGIVKEENVNFMSEVSKKLEEASLPSTIELTDYEKKQEEEAIISYKELIENKDKLYNITDDDEDIDFIEELKSFRNDL